MNPAAAAPDELAPIGTLRRWASLPFSTTMRRAVVSHDNLQTVIEQGDKTEEQQRSWLMDELAPFFANDPVGVFVFGGFVACNGRSH